MSVEDQVVPGAGLEPAWGCPRGIFVPATAFAAARARPRIWGLDFTFTVPRSSPRVRRGPSSLYTFPQRASRPMRA